MYQDREQRMAASVETTATAGEPPRYRRVALVTNSRAGALLRQPAEDGALEAALRAAAGELQVIPPEAGTLPERIAMAQASGAACVVVAGGDGTIACAAAALAGTNTVLGLIPCGTMNLLARDLHLDPANREQAVRSVASGTERAIDVGEVSGRSGEGHVFLCASMLGTPARLGRHREAGRQRGNGFLGWAMFAWAALRALMQNHALRLTLRCNGQVLQRRTPAMSVTVNALDDSSGRLFGRSTLDGGELVIYLVRRGSVLAQLLLLLRTGFTGNLHGPQIEEIRTQALEVECAAGALHVLVDGELRLLAPPLRYVIRPGALHVIAGA
jgi:diacylglycerol kinase family enzyme